MNSFLNKAVGATYKKVDKLNDLLNGPDPRFVSFRENGKDKKIEKISLDARHCHSFIGKMKLDGTGTYSDEVMIAMIKFFFDHTQKGEKIVIELANKVSEYLNGEDSFQDSMTFEVQKNHLFDLARSLSKKRTKDIEIISIEDNNKRLFEVLKHEGIQGLDVASEPSSRLQGFDSLDIARHLYRIAKNNPQYMAEIISLKSEEMRQVSGDSDYYGMIEMAIRINALLHGITLQGGVARQKKYDALLLKHINPYVKDIPGLSDFQHFCSETLKSTSFQGLYFDTKESEKVVTKIDALKTLGNKTRNALLLTLGLGVGIGATTVVNNSIQRAKQKDIVSATIKDIFDNKKVADYGEMGAYEYTGKEKSEKIERYKKDIFERFTFRYGSIGSFSESAFLDKITDCLNDQHVLDELGNGLRSDDVCVEDYIIDEYFIPKYKGELIVNGVAVLPYQQYMQYTNQFVNTILASTTSNNLSISKKLGEYSMKKIGSYGLSISRYALYLSQKDDDGKQYIVASSMYYKGNDDSKGVANIDNAKSIAVDFLKQRYPVINALFENYLIRYYEWDDTHMWTSTGPGKRYLPSEIEDILLKDFLTQGLLKKYPDKMPLADMYEYLDNFVVCNNALLQPLTGNINTSLLPNGFLEKYETALQNTLTNKNGIFDTLAILPASSFSKSELVVEHLGRYKTSEGKIYRVGVAKVGGVQYLYADGIDTGISYGENSYGIYDAQVVAKDYFATKAKFQSLHYK